MSIAHVSKYPENDHAGLEPIHSSLGEKEGQRKERGKDGRRQDGRLNKEGRREKIERRTVVFVPTCTDNSLQL